MAIAAADYRWIALRLPAGLDDEAAFEKNGVTQTVREAIAAAWDDHADATAGRREHALADLFEVLASEVKWTSERQGDSSYDRSLLAERATYWRARAVAGGSDPASFTFVDVDRGDAPAGGSVDEFEQ